MSTNTARFLAASLPIVTAWMLSGELAQAVPIKNPDNCQGPVTIGVATCPDKPGHWVECIPSGDYMCCVKNDQGGKDCEQIEAKTFNPKTGVGRLPGGVLQEAPMTVALQFGAARSECRQVEPDDREPPCTTQHDMISTGSRCCNGCAG